MLSNKDVRFPALLLKELEPYPDGPELSLFPKSSTFFGSSRVIASAGTEHPDGKVMENEALSSLPFVSFHETPLLTPPTFRAHGFLLHPFIYQETI